MKNLKLFVAPLLGATLLLTACGPKPVSAEDFKKKVEANYNIKAISDKYKGQSMYMTGTNIDTDQLVGKISGAKESEISEAGVKLAGFTFEANEPEALVPYTILNTDLVTLLGTFEEDVKVNYFISGGTYTIDLNGELDGQKISAKIAYKEDLVISRLEAKGPNPEKSGEQMDIKYNFKYKE